MAQYDMTEEITAIITAGLRTADELLADRSLSLDHDDRDGSWTAWNRRTESAINDLVHLAQQAAPTAPAAQTTTPASTAQVDLITKLLIQRVRTGDSSGFAAVDNLYNEGGVDIHAVRVLTKPEASQLIDSLRGRY